MITKRLLILLVAVVFTLSVAGLSFSAQEVKGTVTKIEGSKLTIMDDVGKEKIVRVKNQESLKEIKLGDRVSIKDGMLAKEAVESPKPAPMIPSK
jgi:outer membrane lipoprotein SlyB